MIPSGPVFLKKGFDINKFNIKTYIKCLSRFKSKKEQDNIISEIKNGQCNIIVGTHKVIQKDVKFKSLGIDIIEAD